MNEQTIRFRIGIFVLAALILLAVMITLFGGFPNYFRHVDTFTIVFKDAQGIAAGTPVRRSGLRIGEVRALALDNATGNVQVTIQVDAGFNLRQGDRPTVVQGLLGGDTSIAFLPPPGEPKGPVVSVEPGAVLQGFTQVDAQTLVQKTAEVMPQAEEAMLQVKKVFQKLDSLMPLLESTFKEYNEIGKAARETIPALRKTNDEIRELAKTARDTLPEFKKTNDELQVTSRQWTKVGERMDIILSTNEDKINKAINQIDDTLRRVSRTFSDENQKYVTDTLKNVRTSSDRLDSIAKNTEDFLKESRETVKRVNASLVKTEVLLEDMQRSTKAVSERSPAIMKNVEESTDKLNRTLADVRELIHAVGRGDGTIQRLLADPSLYNNINDTATMVNKMLPRLDRALRDVEIFADKLARHPELLGVGGAIRPSSGVKETHSVIPWRYGN
jgi:phospholipid/cholesterol/gamma-HCH transport system substrate-binding protein